MVWCEIDLGVGEGGGGTYVVRKQLSIARTVLAEVELVSRQGTSSPFWKPLGTSGGQVWGSARLYKELMLGERWRDVPSSSSVFSFLTRWMGSSSRSSSAKEERPRKYAASPDTDPAAGVSV